MITANKGEWSEIYALFKLLSDGELFAGDQDLNKKKELIYPIIKIIRQEARNQIEYSPKKTEGIVEIINGKQTFIISLSELDEITSFLLLELKKPQKSSFSIPRVEGYMSNYNCNTIKAKSNFKSDVKIVIYDKKIGTTPELGFSIKSKIGKSSTLLNAGKTTNFIFEVKGINMTPQEINEFNNYKFDQPIIQSRINDLEKRGASVDFAYVSNPVFRNNLILIDSLLPQIMAEALYKYYTSPLNSLRTIFNAISDENPLKYSNEHNHPFYHYKVKRFLCETAIGMMPGTVWTGSQIDATGGYLVIKEDGDIICYHLYHRHEFEEYLYNNTKFEAASKKRHGYGILFTENGKLFISLNLQIRFK